MGTNINHMPSHHFILPTVRFHQTYTAPVNFSHIYAVSSVSRCRHRQRRSRSSSASDLFRMGSFLRAP